MTEGGTPQELIHEASHSVGFEGASFTVGVHVLLEIPFAVLEDQDKLCLRVDHVVQTDDVDVLQLLHEGDFPDSSRGGSFFRIEVYFLQGHDLVGGPRASLVVTLGKAAPPLVATFTNLVNCGIRSLACPHR